MSRALPCGDQVNRHPSTAIGVAVVPIFIAPFLGLVAVIATDRRRDWVTAAIAGGSALALAHGIGDGWSWAVAIFAAVWLIAAALVGAGLGARRRFTREVQARMQLTERSREEEARRRMAEEVPASTTPARMVATSRPSGSQSHIQNRPSCQRGHSPS